MEIATPRPKARRRPNTAVRKDVRRDKHTLLLDPDTSRKLSVAASLRGLDRSDLVNELLADALRYIVISVRSTNNDRRTEGAGINPDAGDEAA